MRVLALILLLLPLPVWAQSPEPKVEVTLSEDTVIPGQPTTLRIKVLVPTWMTTPPVYPEMGSATLLARLPDRATTSISETINGDTWSGTSRAYRLYPLVPGDVALSGLAIRVTYADPGKTEPLVVDLPLPDVTFSAKVPAAARDLDPFIAGTGFSLDQQIDGGPDLETGGSVVRSLTAKLTGATPLLIPDLLAEAPTGPLRAYPDEPQVNEQEQRGFLEGSRSQRVTYVAQDGGTASLPPVSVDWFNIKTGKVETASVDGVDLTIAPPPRPPLDPRQIAIAVGAVSTAIALLWMALRFLGPPVKRWRQARRKAWQNSEAFAAKMVRTALRSRDLGQIYAALDVWHAQSQSQSPKTDAALLNISAQTYGSGQTNTVSWAAVQSAFEQDRKRTAQESSAALPPLNFG